MKKWVIGAVAMIAVVAVLGGCGAKTEKKAAVSDKKTFALKYAELNPNNHIMDNCADEFARLVKEKSKGRITIDVFPAGQLGDEKTAYQTLQMGGGAIDIARGNTNSLGDFGAKKLTLFGLPFTFRDREHLWKVLNSDIGPAYLKEMQEINSGMVGLFYLDEGA
ncbi:MAG: TRAP transporter substrate-binding protein DctP, partial [Treponemataceae bacterium]